MKMPLLSICCICYNQEQYISDALESFVKQQTSFPYEIVISDDCSTDNTRCIIERFKHNYPSLFRDISPTHNIGPVSNFYYVLSEAKGKYIAVCEGDDFWTDVQKLQRQVDFLEANPDYVLCFHRVKVLSSRGVPSLFFNHLEEREFSAEEIYEKWTIPTCSAVFRSSALNHVSHNDFIIYGDIYLWLQLAEVGRFFCLGIDCAVYRRNSDGLSVRWNLNTYKKLFKQYRYFEKRFPQFKSIAKRDQDNTLRVLIYAPYFRGIWRYRFLYMFRHPRLFLTSFFSTTLLSYTPIRYLRKKYTS